ncbi:MAG TPA: DNA starvation/stationary phase protection protein [Actinophytocola sp.]|uniref:Dps family protein n=1 Tax=Actinophytocola sp. TaxID=1872138 RepID=UPI002DDCF144|nr:DNA starvation/stationary phase protection protein [Actinophytocola sp.]HEV2782499.1 DNA starvation/stationary phase protection protein [Actinophytocola sp.]
MTKPISSPLNEDDRQTIGAILQSTLAELIDLSLIGKQAHWNVVGRQFRSVHLHLDELVAMARTHTDEVAERAAAIGVAPNGKARTVAETSGLSGFPDGWTSDVDTVEAIVAVLGELIKRLRMRIDEADKSDLVTQDLLIEVVKDLEQQHWMWQAQQAGA